jgi:hypothetical protein
MPVLTRAATLDHTFAMLASLFSRRMVLWLAVCVLLLFLFPLVHGPFQATHGPNTAFRARRALLALILSIMQGGMSLLARFHGVTKALIHRSDFLLESHEALCRFTFDSLMRC